MIVNSLKRNRTNYGHESPQETPSSPNPGNAIATGTTIAKHPSLSPPNKINLQCKNKFLIPSLTQTKPLSLRIANRRQEPPGLTLDKKTHKNKPNNTDSQRRLPSFQTVNPWSPQTPPHPRLRQQHPTQPTKSPRCGRKTNISPTSPRSPPKRATPWSMSHSKQARDYRLRQPQQRAKPLTISLRKQEDPALR